MMEQRDAATGQDAKQGAPGVEHHDATDTPVNAASPYSSAAPDLLERHLRDESGLAVDVIRERGYRSTLGKHDFMRFGFKESQWAGPGMLIPTHGTDGKPSHFVYRPDHPKERNGKASKYVNPLGEGLSLDVHPHSRPSLGDPATPLFITEGVKKGDALVTHGFPAIVLHGVWGFKGKNPDGGVTVLPDWDDVALNGRDVTIIYDSDVMTKPSVRRAMERLAAHIKRKGGKPRFAHPPANPDDLEGWPHERRQLVDDLWALGLPHLAEAAEIYRDTKPEELKGRELEPWRLVLTMAHLVDRHAGTAHYDEMVAFALAKRSEAHDAGEMSDEVWLLRALVRLVVEDGRDTSAADDIATRIDRLAVEAGVREPGSGEHFMASSKVGKLLNKLRLKKRGKNHHGSRRLHALDHEAIVERARAYGVFPEAGMDGADGVDEVDGVDGAGGIDGTDGTDGMDEAATAHIPTAKDRGGGCGCRILKVPHRVPTAVGGGDLGGQPRPPVQNLQDLLDVDHVVEPDLDRGVGEREGAALRVDAAAFPLLRR